MSLNWNEKELTLNNFSVKLINENNDDILVLGTVLDNDENPANNITYWAPAPADRLQSFSGSGLPFPNPEVAYDNTPNYDNIEVVNGQFEFRMKYPNSYYTELGTGLIPPIVNLKVDGSDKTTTFKIDDGIPFRSLTHLKNHTVEFYARDNCLVRSQEDILRSSGYNSENPIPSNFWGPKPSV